MLAAADWGVRCKNMNNEGCPICGYKEITVLDEYGCTTFEICDSCGCEAGYEYDLKSNLGVGDT